MRRIILFDGDCQFCNQSAQFIIKHDSDIGFSLASLQSEIGQKLLNKFSIPHLDSLVLVEEKSFYTKSTAALRIAKHLDKGWKFFYILILIPKPIRDFFYDLIAKNRLTWFGQTKSCLIPNHIDKKRFLK